MGDWRIKNVSDETKMKFKLYAVKNKITIAEALAKASKGL